MYNRQVFLEENEISAYELLVKDLAHALVHCSHAKQFWVQAQMLFDFTLPKLHPNTWSRDILCDQLFSERERAITVTVM